MFFLLFGVFVIKNAYCVAFSLTSFGTKIELHDENKRNI